MGYAGIDAVSYDEKTGAYSVKQKDVDTFEYFVVGDERFYRPYYPVTLSDPGIYYVYAGYNGLEGICETYIWVGDAAAESSAKQTFTDVSANAYYYDSVAWAVEKGITNGTSATTFSPNATCTTAQILTFLWRAIGSPEPSITNPFSDLKTTDYYYKSALWAYENGLISGTVFGGGAPCTRNSTVTYLWKLAGQPEPQGANPFTDVSSDAKAVTWALEQGITSGTSATTFSPDATCTRGQIVTFLYRDLA